MPSCWNSMAAGFSVLEQRRSFMVRIGPAWSCLNVSRAYGKFLGFHVETFSIQCKIIIPRRSIV
jgi:hypothetical protein